MEELKFLSEKDMEYFYDLEAHNEAIILRLDPDQLLNLDLSELFDDDKIVELDMEGLKAWLKEHDVELQERSMENQSVSRENHQIKNALDGKSEEDSSTIEAGPVKIPENREQAMETLVSRLQSVRLNEQQSAIINNAIQQGLDEKQILTLLMDGMTAEKMQKMFEIFMSLRETD